MSAACATCNGTGGHVEDTSGNGATRQNWVSCADCRGTGAR